MTQKTFPIAECERWRRPNFSYMQKTGEFRAPRSGEWYLSGAIPEAYYARVNFANFIEVGNLCQYHILEPAPRPICAAEVILTLKQVLECRVTNDIEDGWHFQRQEAYRKADLLIREYEKWEAME